MLTQLRIAPTLFLCLACFFLADCATPPETVSPVKTTEKKSRYPLAADAYLAMAQNQQGSEKQNLQLLAAGRLIEEGRWSQARVILTQISGLTAQQLADKTILSAKIDLQRSSPGTAIEKLAGIQKPEALPPSQQESFHQVLASAYEASGKVIESVNERIKLEQFLADQEDRSQNQRALWKSLATLPTAELSSLNLETRPGSVLQGWLSLALISRQSASQASQLVQDLQQWREENPEHPGNSLLPASLSQLASQLPNRPKQIALLLPLSGGLAGPGTAIRDGFMAAKDKDGQSMTVKQYNTAGSKVAELYQQAIAEGADFVIGPLTKADVAEVAALSHPVPTLVLNEGASSSDNLYQFALSPVSEAKQVAIKARKDGMRRALVIAPAGSWGQEVSTAFTQTFKQSGGLVVDSMTYDGKTDLTTAVQAMLKVNDSQAREAKMRRLLGNKVQTTLSRREDFDMIFLLAYPSKARQIMPLLKYYFAGNVPVYATSTAYSGQVNPKMDKDLNGIKFCDMPWIFNHQAAYKNWPEQLNSYNRLYAMGLDSYALASDMNQLKIFPMLGAQNKSGLLYLKENGQIAQVLQWGTFNNGLAVPSGPLG